MEQTQHASEPARSQPDSETWRPCVPVYGWDAWAAALQDPRVQLYKRTLFGERRTVTREEAASLVASSAYGSLYAEV